VCVALLGEAGAEDTPTERVVCYVEGGTACSRRGNRRAERTVCVARLNDESTIHVRVADVEADVCFHLFFHTPSIARLARVYVT